MAAGSTYTPIATTTLGSDTSNVTFSSIAGTYTDLILVINAGVNPVSTMNIQVNNDSSTIYTWTRMYGSGTSAASDRSASQSSWDFINFPNSLDNNAFLHFMNYSNTTTYKTVLNRWNTSSYTVATVALWRSTAAITSIKLYNAPSNLKSGSTFTLYGIAAA